MRATTSRCGPAAPELADEINETHRNPGYLGDVGLPTSIRATSDPAEALTGACTVLLAVPSQTLRANLDRWSGLLGDDATLVSVAKGIELDTLMRMSQVVVQVTGADPSRVAVVTGPNLASEIAEEQPAATVVACADSGRAVDAAARAVHRVLPARTPTPTSSAPKSAAHARTSSRWPAAWRRASGLGENTVAAIITRGLAEIMRLGIALGAKAATLAGLAGVGDLVATCTSPHSRNRTFGERLGEGRHHGGGEAGGGRAHRRRRHLLPIGAGAGGQL